MYGILCNVWTAARPPAEGDETHRMKLEVKDLVKSFGEKRVLREISLSVSSGKALGLLGRNGAGKTTAIRIIMGIFPPDAGQVLLDGAPIHRRGLRIGYMPEERGLYPKQVIMDQLCYLGELQGMKRSALKARVTSLLERLGMGDTAGKKLDTLSKGNQQKIQLVATLLADPDIVVLDEPFSGLDPVNAALLKDVVKELIGQGKLLFFSSHQMHYVEEFCDDVAILNAGKIVLSGSIREIKRGYDRRRVQITGGQGSEIESFLRERGGEWAGHVERLGAAADAPVRVTMKAEEQKAALLGALLAQGFDLDRFEVYEPTLNEIFVAYTEGGI